MWILNLHETFDIIHCSAQCLIVIQVSVFEAHFVYMYKRFFIIVYIKIIIKYWKNMVSCILKCKYTACMKECMTENILISCMQAKNH